MLRWVCIFCLMAAPVSAQNWCLSPLENGQPVSEIELHQPYRLASETISIPGYPYLIVRPGNRYQLHTIRDRRFEKLETDYPALTGWSYRNSQVADDGTVYGFLNRPKQVFRLDPGTDKFAALPITGYQRARLDERTDRILAYYPGQGLLEWDGQSLVQASPDGLDYVGKYVLPLYVQALEGYLAVSDDRLYFRRDGENRDWIRIRLGHDNPLNLWDIQLSRTHFDPEQNIFVVHVGHTVLVFHVSQGDVPEYAYSVEAEGEVYFSDTGPTLVIKNRARSKANQMIVRDPVILTWFGPRPPKRDEFLDRDRPKETSLIVPLSRTRETIFQMPPLLRLKSGWFYYDGAEFYAVPHLTSEKIGTFPRWFYWKNRVFVLHLGGWSELLPDLSLRHGSLSITYRSTYDIDVYFSETFDGIFLTHRQSGIWYSSDGSSFDQIYRGPVEVQEYLSDVPNETFGLVLGENGLYLLEKACRE